MELEGKALKNLRGNLEALRSGLGEWELVKLWSASAQLTGLDLNLNPKPSTPNPKP